MYQSRFLDTIISYHPITLITHAKNLLVFFVMTVAAAEAAVGLAIILALFRHRESVDLKDANVLQG